MHKSSHSLTTGRKLEFSSHGSFFLSFFLSFLLFFEARQKVFWHFSSLGTTICIYSRADYSSIASWHNFQWLIGKQKEGCWDPPDFIASTLFLFLFHVFFPWKCEQSENVRVSEVDKKTLKTLLVFESSELSLICQMATKVSMHVLFACIALQRTYTQTAAACTRESKKKKSNPKCGFRVTQQIPPL